MDKFKYIFGPVPSRRLGYSLGVDVIPYKTCSFDCIYCELGKTTNNTIERKEYIPSINLKIELKKKLESGLKIDYITFSGSGEPTLYSRLKELIDFIKETTNIPVALLTNGSLLWNKNVQKDIKNIDLVIPSLDAGNEKNYKFVNRPHKNLEFKKVVDGLINFSYQFKNKIWLEILVLKNITDSEEEIIQIADYTKKMHLDKIQLNSAYRPGTESYAKPVSFKKMNQMKKYFTHKVEIIGNFIANEKNKIQTNSEDIINLLKRRPCTIDDISGGLQIHRTETIKQINQLLQNGIINKNNINHKVFYFIK
ncbi:MAG: radical SAM protein [Spirochaetes bacterium]|nr:radical SAM protein [Spirochaetota bacterium]